MEGESLTTVLCFREARRQRSMPDLIGIWNCSQRHFLPSWCSSHLNSKFTYLITSCLVSLNRATWDLRAYRSPTWMTASWNYAHVCFFITEGALDLSDFVALFLGGFLGVWVQVIEGNCKDCKKKKKFVKMVSYHFPRLNTGIRHWRKTK